MHILKQLKIHFQNLIISQLISVGGESFSAPIEADTKPEEKLTGEEESIGELKKELETVQLSKKFVGGMETSLRNGLVRDGDPADTEYHELADKVKLYQVEIKGLDGKEKAITEQLNGGVQEITDVGFDESDTVGISEDVEGRVSYKKDLEINQEYLDTSFDEANDYFRNEFIDSLELGEVSEFVTNLIENKDLSTITAGEIYNLRQEGYDLSSLFLVGGEDFVSKDDMGPGDTFTVNFGGNSDLNKNIGAGDLLPIEKIDKVIINGVEGTRGFEPRPGYYSPDGKYLAIFDNYEIEVVSEKELTDEEMEVSKNAFESRFDQIRGTELSSRFRDALGENGEESSLDLEGFSESDLQYLQGYLEKYIPEEEMGNIDFDIENGTVSTVNGESLSDFIADVLPQGKGYEKYRDVVNEVASRYPGISPEKLTTLINHENAGWDPLISAPGSSAFGLGQMIDSTWATYGKGLDRNNPVDQLEATCKYLEAIMGRKGCAVELAMAYYNTGEGILNISDSKAREYASINPAIANKIPGGESMNAKTYLTGAVAYYNDISYDQAKTKI